MACSCLSDGSQLLNCISTTSSDSTMPTNPVSLITWLDHTCIQDVTDLRSPLHAELKGPLPSCRPHTKATTHHQPGRLSLIHTPPFDAPARQPVLVPAQGTCTQNFMGPALPSTCTTVAWKVRTRLSGRGSVRYMIGSNLTERCRQLGQTRVDLASPCRQQAGHKVVDLARQEGEVARGGLGQSVQAADKAAVCAKLTSPCRERRGHQAAQLP